MNNCIKQLQTQKEEVTCALFYKCGIEDPKIEFLGVFTNKMTNVITKDIKDNENSLCPRHIDDYIIIPLKINEKRVYKEW